MKKAIILARVSTLGQAEEELPIDSQIEVSRKKAGELDAEVVKVFIEDGVSGRRLDRDVFDEAVDYCRIHEIDYFILWNTARFARHRALAAWTKFNLRRGGTEMVYVSQNINTATNEGWLLEGLFELMDENMSRTVSADTKRSMMKNARDGCFNGGTVPFGYASEEHGKRRRLRPSPDEAPIVVEIFHQFLSGAGTKTIARVMNEAGRLRRGRTWTKNHVIYMLKNLVYVGYVTFNRFDHDRKQVRPESEWIRTKGHEAIISEENFMTVQQLFRDKTTPRLQGSPKSRYLFTGILRCGVCDQGMQIETATGRARTYSYYNCRGALRGAGCSNRRIPADDLDTWLLQAVLDRILNRDAIAAVVDQLYEIKGRWVKDREATRAALVSEMRNAESRRRRLFEVLELHGRDAPNLGDLKPRLEQLNAKIRETETKLQELEIQEIPAIDVDDGQIEEMTIYFSELLAESGDPKKVRDFLATFIDKVMIGADGAVIHYQPGKIIGGSGQAGGDGGGLVQSAGGWHPINPLLRTKILALPLPDRFRKAA